MMKSFAIGVTAFATTVLAILTTLPAGVTG